MPTKPAEDLEALLLLWPKQSVHGLERRLEPVQTRIRNRQRRDLLGEIPCRAVVIEIHAPLHRVSAEVVLYANKDARRMSGELL